MESPRSKIAVVGIAAQLPGGFWSRNDLDYDSFFDFLLAGGESYEPMPKDRFNTAYLCGKGPGKMITDKGAFLKDLDSFDHTEFGVTAKDALHMPLSLRRLIELAFLSLRDSGIDYRGRNVGCYMSGIVHDVFALSGHDDAEVKGSFASGPAMMANRVSYHLDRRGPSVPLDTACSSSLYSTHLAVQALRNDECEAAVVGGCQLNHRFLDWLNYSQGGILSPDGKCKPFDKSADGFGRGEGAVCIVLKRVDDAARDGDYIYATILGTGVNSSGSAAPVNAPVAEAQLDAAKRAFSQTGRAPQEVDFIELHATGTAMGDPTEANWVGAHFAREDELRIGSVKGNIGHLEITAFLASLCKVSAAFRAGLIPPNVNFAHPNPAIRWQEYKLRVPTEVEKLGARSPSGRALVAMTSSGIGGANGHCVVEAPAVSAPTPPTFWVSGSDVEAPNLLVAGGLSPRSSTAVAEILSTLSQARGVKLAKLARRLGRGARSMTWRSFAVVEKGSSTLPKFSEPVMARGVAPSLVFVFSGQGTQYWEMGRQLFKTCAPFRASVMDLDGIYASAVGKSLLDATGLFHEDPAENALGDIWPVSVTLPALTMIQLALMDALAAVGVRPDIVVGHSAGETAMLYASGAASKAAALELAIARGSAMALMEDKAGTMAAVSCSQEDAQKIIDSVKAELGNSEVLEIGCFNARDAITLSGSERYIDVAVEKAKAANIFARKLRTRVPVHSTMMRACEDEHRARVGAVFERHGVARPTVETYSTKTGCAFADAFDAEYFWNATLGPVRFAVAMEAVAATHTNAAFVEIGPHPVLTTYISAALSISGGATTSSHTISCPLRRPKKGESSNDMVSLLGVLGQLVVAGHKGVDFDALCGTPGYTIGELRTKLPPYPLARKIVPHQISTTEVVRQKQPRNGPLNYPQLRVNVDTHPGLKDHVIKNEPIMPAAGFMEMAFEFGATRLYQVAFSSLLTLSSARPVPVNVALEGNKWSVHSVTEKDESQVWPLKYDRTHASGFLSLAPLSDQGDDDREYPPLDIAALREPMEAVTMEGFYDGFSSFAQYGPMYRRIEKVHRADRGDGGVDLLVEIRGDNGDIPNLSDYVLHPAILDAAFHTVVHPIVTGNYDKDLYHLPHHVRKVTLHPGVRNPVRKKLFSHLTFSQWSPDSIVYDMVLVNESGKRLCTIEGMEVALHGYRMKTVAKRLEVVYRPSGITLPTPHDTRSSDNSMPTPSHAKTRILTFTRGGEMELQRELRVFSDVDPISLWLVAVDGTDGDACLGFTRALRREYLAWKVHAIVFERSWSHSAIAASMQTVTTLLDFPLESFIGVDGHVQVPLVEPIAPLTPLAPHSADFDLPWTLYDHELRNTPPPPVPERHALIRVIGVEPLRGRVWAFMGEAQRDSSLVVGITAASPSSHLTVHEGSVALVDAKDVEPARRLSHPPFLARTLLALAIGPSSLADPRRRSELHVLVTHRETEIGSQLIAACLELGIRLSAVSGTPSDSEIERCYDSLPTTVLSGARSEADVQLLQQLLPLGCQPVLWDHSAAGISRLLHTAPWVVGDAVRAALAGAREHGLEVPFMPPTDMIPRTPELLTTAPIFHPSKCYLLIGGVGHIGIHVANWMYERGARHIVLTSRRGRAGINKDSDFMTQRLFRHLEAIKDLSLDVRSADATSVDAMAGVVQALERPLGGCMLLPFVLSDHSFATHRPETFEAAFPPKVDAFRVFEQLVSIDSLDFMIHLSSASSLFGNPGQTNYASANSIVTGMIRKYRKAFAITAPYIFDSRLDMLQDLVWRLRHMIRWAMSTRDLCDCIEDGIKILRQRPLWQYVPDLDFDLIREDLGPSPLYDHLGADRPSAPTDPRRDGYTLIFESVCRVLGLKAEEVSADVPLTSYGLDSLSASSLSHALKPVLVISPIQLLATMTLRDIESRIDASDDSGQGSRAPLAADQRSVAQRSATEDMIELLRKCAALLPQAVVSTHPERPELCSIVITGTTGSLGAHLLARLLRASSFNMIYVLLRAESTRSDAEAKSRQRDAFDNLGLDVALLDSERMVLVRCTLEDARLGIAASLYDEIRDSVSHVFHIGWLVDFRAPLEAFAPTLRGLGNLVALAAATDRRPAATLVFSSSSAVFRKFDRSRPPAEDRIDDPSTAAGVGYSESKWVAEQLLHRASDSGAIDALIVRVGQLCGGLSGAWKASEWFPAIVSASATLRCLPDGKGVVSWISPDAAAQVIAEVALRAGPERIVHVRHPQPQPWTSLIGYLASALDVPVVAFPEWVQRLRAAGLGSEAGSKYLAPALHLLGSFEAMDSDEAMLPGTENNGLSCLLGLARSEEACSVLRSGGIPALGLEDVARWVAYWRRVGALPGTA